MPCSENLKDLKYQQFMPLYLSTRTERLRKILTFCTEFLINGRSKRKHILLEVPAAKRSVNNNASIRVYDRMLSVNGT